MHHQTTKLAADARACTGGGHTVLRVPVTHVKLDIHDKQKSGHTHFCQIFSFQKNIFQKSKHCHLQRSNTNGTGEHVARHTTANAGPFRNYKNRQQARRHRHGRLCRASTISTIRSTVLRRVHWHNVLCDIQYVLNLNHFSGPSNTLF